MGILHASCTASRVTAAALDNASSPGPAGATILSWAVLQQGRPQVSHPTASLFGKKISRSLLMST